MCVESFLLFNDFSHEVGANLFVVYSVTETALRFIIQIIFNRLLVINSMYLPLSYFFKRPQYWFGLIFMSVCWLIGKSPLKVQLFLANVIYWLLTNVSKRRKRIAEINLRLCFPEKSDTEIQQLLQKNLKQTAFGIVEIAACWFSNLGSRKKQTMISGQQNLEAALSKGKGVILLSFHLTDLEIGGCLLGEHFPITAMYKPNKNPLIERMMCVGRLKHIKALLKQDDVRGTIKALKKNQIVWYASDQNNAGKSSLFVPFFGIQTATITATTKFAQLTGATVVPFTQRRSEDGRSFELSLHPCLEHFPGETPEIDAIRINRFLEDYLNSHPENYLWLHQRFRTRPPGEAKIYP